MKITVGTSSQALLNLWSDAQKTQIETTSKDYTPDRVYMFKVVTPGATIYLENNGTSTITDGFPFSNTDGALIVPAQNFSEINLIGSMAGIDVRILAI